jgi:predicted nucleic acid-binding protein
MRLSPQTAEGYIRSKRETAVKIVADAYAWVELFSGSQKGVFVKSAMEEAETVITPDTVLAEVARKYIKEGIEEGTVRKRLSTILEASEPSYMYDEVAIEAGKAYLQLEARAKKMGLKKPSLFEGLVLAVTRRTDGKVLTEDEHFHGLPETMWIES